MAYRIVYCLYMQTSMNALPTLPAVSILVLTLLVASLVAVMMDTY